MNRFGLDSRYFKDKLSQLVRDADNYRPDEMRRALENLTEVASHQEKIVNKEKSVDNLA